MTNNNKNLKMCQLKLKFICHSIVLELVKQCHRLFHQLARKALKRKDNYNITTMNLMVEQVLNLRSVSQCGA